MDGWMDGWMDKGILLSHTKEILSFSTTWIKHERIMLREISQAEKRQTLYDLFSLNCRIQKC
jgi:hypothetical protein